MGSQISSSPNVHLAGNWAGTVWFALNEQQYGYGRRWQISLDDADVRDIVAYGITDASIKSWYIWSWLEVSGRSRKEWLRWGGQISLNDLSGKWVPDYRASYYEPYRRWYWA